MATWAIEAHSKVPPTDFCFRIALDFAENGPRHLGTTQGFQGSRRMEYLGKFVRVQAECHNWNFEKKMV